MDKQNVTQMTATHLTEGSSIKGVEKEGRKFTGTFFSPLQYV
jgi:hypothetical protein